MKAPPEPALVRLTPTCVEMLVERYAGFLVETKTRFYYGALPESFVAALMQFSLSGVPIVRAINTAPLVTISGQLIDGVGLDRNTGPFIGLIPFFARACRHIHLPKTTSVLR